MKVAYLPTVPPDLYYRFRDSSTGFHFSSFPHSHFFGRYDKCQGRHTGVFMRDPDMYGDMILCTSICDG
jgi:hypothetical protein